MKNKHIRLTALMLVFVLFCSCGIGQLFEKDPRATTPNLLWLQPYGTLSAAVVYSSQSSSQGWEETYAQLSQSTLANLTITLIDLEVEDSPDWSLYTLLYPDSSVLTHSNWDSFRKALVSYVKEGGALYLDHAFADQFDLDFLGLSAAIPLIHEGQTLTYPEVSADLEPLQQLIQDAVDFDQLENALAFRPSAATPLALSGELVLSSLNKAGKGYVLLSPPLRQDEVTTAGWRLLFRSSFAAYISREKYGLSLERVFGSYGRPAMSWQLAENSLSDMEGDFATHFGELAKEYLQVPSYSLSRNAYQQNENGESILYLLGQEGEPFAFAQEVEESTLSSGAHLIVDDQWLALAGTEGATPFVVDLDGDGILDLLSGGGDGFLYFFRGLEGEEPLSFAPGEPLAGLRINALRTTGASTPVAAHIDSDSHLDIVSGTDDGTVVRYSGTETLAFIPREVLLNTGLGNCQTFPDLADINGDDILDLLVGTDTGHLFLYYGVRTLSGVGYNGLTRIDLSDAVAELGSRIVPRFVDWSGDGQWVIAIGTEDGYVATLAHEEDGWTLSGYLTGEKVNQRGNNRLCFGRNAAPFFADINGDGVTDLMVGCLETDMAYPIDSPLFPAAEQLAAQIAYLKDNGFYVGFHTYAYEYADSEQGGGELALHQQAFAAYGLPTDGVGANQHLGNSGSMETFLHQYQSGILWNSGYDPMAGNSLALPFYPIADGDPTILLHSPTLLSADTVHWLPLAARYNIPLTLSYNANQHTPEEVIAMAGEFRDAYRYSFVGEDQLFKSIHAAYNTHVTAWLATEETEDGSVIQQPWEEVGYPDNIFDGYTLVLVPEVLSEESGLYDAEFQNAVGVKLTLSERNSSAAVQTNADVWLREGNVFYLALNKGVQVYIDDTVPVNSHLVQVNLPANITQKKSSTVIAFSQGGMMQVVIAGTATLKSEGWIVTELEGYTQYTRYGKEATLELSFAGG